MFEEVLIAGFGGQGIIFAGRLLCEAALAEGKQVACAVSYGPEMRGGTANSSVVISDEPIGSTVVTHPTVAIVMNGPSMTKFEPRVRPSGLLIVNRTLVHQESRREGIETTHVPASAMAGRIGNKDVANVVLLGVLLAARPVVSPGALREALDKMLPKGRADLRVMNDKALRMGMEWVKRSRLAVSTTGG